MIGATTSLIIALAWAGVQYSWASTQTLVPLILGVVGLVAFMGWEAKFAIEPVVPWELVSNRTSAFGYMSIFCHGMSTTAGVCEFMSFSHLMASRMNKGCVSRLPPSVLPGSCTGFAHQVRCATVRRRVHGCTGCYR